MYLFAFAVSKTEQKEIKLEIQLPQGGFPKSMYFNRFRIEREDGFCIVQFGLITASGLLDSCTCVFTQEALEDNRAALLDYLNRIGRPAEKTPVLWKGPALERQTEVADIITMSFRKGMAEIGLYSFSQFAATKSAQKGSSGMQGIIGQAMVLLRCTAETQKQLIVALYEE